MRSGTDELLAYFARWVALSEDAADCLPETLLVLWRRRDASPVAHDERRAWTYGVAHRVLAVHRRTGIRQLALTGRLRDELRSRPIAPQSKDDSAIAALATLTPRDRELVTLVAWDGLTIAETGAVVGIRPDPARA